MDTLSAIQKKFNELNSDSVAQISSLFMELSSQLKKENASEGVQKCLDRLFKKWMALNQGLTTESKKMLSSLEQSVKLQEYYLEEKRRFEALFVSGIVFTSITEMQQLMEKAITTIVKELRADAGFIVLTDKDGQVSHTFARNMDPDEDKSAKEMSMSVVERSMHRSKPVNMDNDNDDTNISLFEANSVINLGIKSALCVPLLTEQKVLGAVYLDRRDSEQSFTEADLKFFMSFARQIVQGMDISQEISNLEDKLIDEANLRFEDLRKNFDCREIIGNSKKLFEILKIASKISATNASVIILGENGTGKELIAQAIHKNSRRAEKPFVAINCSAIPRDLLESELFGYESGAFTGANKSKEGKFELANGGTLFLDEIGEMSVNLQAKLLRVIQTQEIERLGSVRPKKIDVRILSATNRELQTLIKEGEFREDLYYRLKVVELTMPPLRERKEDIEALSGYFLSKHAQNNEVLKLSEEALFILEEYDWPGNIRELENVILRGIVLAKENEIHPDELPEELHQKAEDMPAVGVGNSLADAELEFRRMYVLRTLRNAGSKAEAAKILGINRTHFYRILSQLGIE
ncbi:MAG: sigma-54-dependent Fis family transcriptional regulator [Calditrichaeota bacterium]|nr:MAG: GAF domain-containing protein [Calditrichota bacterium]MBL1207366.1 sigma-54-dependent Fis family transcriptional regulator [Calditrichota bacterium]NOG47198.1 sigma-54-dependent Fis family transcriptional regulator [Calditrichota bacterium]